MKTIVLPGLLHTSLSVNSVDKVKRRTKRKEYNFTLYVSVRNQFYL